jgi:plasmid stabilization system protein ParE
MRLVLHPKVYSDIDEIMGYYERIATPELSREFYAELRHYMRQAAERPESFPIRERDLRRVNFAALPLSFLVSHRWRRRADSRCTPSQETSHRWYQAPVMSRRRGAAFPHARNGD